ncbi:MAG TPA: hypothetical protein VJ352_11195 [Geodermatophilus sp.]|nr:hypothetical protein [Geodermatophilus sp.]
MIETTQVTESQYVSVFEDQQVELLPPRTTMKANGGGGGGPNRNKAVQVITVVQVAVAKGGGDATNVAIIGASNSAG